MTVSAGGRPCGRRTEAFWGLQRCGFRNAGGPSSTQCSTATLPHLPNEAFRPEPNICLPHLHDLETGPAKSVDPGRVIGSGSSGRMPQVTLHLDDQGENTVSEVDPTYPGMGVTDLDLTIEATQARLFQ